VDKGFTEEVKDFIRGSVNYDPATASSVPHFPPASSSAAGGSGHSASAAAGAAGPENKKKGFKYSGELGQIIEETIIDTNMNVKWEDVIGIDDAKNKMKETIILPHIRPELFKGLRAPTKGILLFGPPGNGKTMTAKAVVSMCSDITFFNVSAGTLTSRYFGDSEKLIQALFGKAAEKQPTVIFIDEIDSIMGQRSSDEHDASKRLKTEFLVQFDGVSSNSEDKIVVIGATNRPFDLDEAVLRRFTSRIYIGQPNKKARKAIIGRLLNQVDSRMSEEDMNELLVKTVGYSAADLTALCREASMEPVREIPVENLVKMDQKDIRPLQIADFMKALTKVLPSVSKKSLKEYDSWNKMNQV
jgi:spastin